MNQSPSTDAKPTHEQVALRAELLWKAKGSPSGQDEQIWLEAERQLYEEAKEILANSAASTSVAETSSKAQNASAQQFGSSSADGENRAESTARPSETRGSTPTEPSSVSSEKMTGKPASSPKPAKEQRRK